MPAAELSEADLAAWGERFGRGLRAPGWVALRGELGAGKTTLVRAIARGLGVTESVTSPTYGVVREYGAPIGRVFHLDLYRLTDPGELHQLGWEEIVRHGAVVMVEWPEVAAGSLPGDCVTLTLEHLPGRPDARRLSW